MAVVLRLSRRGHSKSPFYRIVVKERLSSRDGKFKEIVGTYNPLTNPSTVTLKEDRIKWWIEHGATATSVVRDIIRKKMPNLIEAREEHQLKKLQAARKARKARAAARGAPAKKAPKAAEKATKKAAKKTATKKAAE